VQIRAVRGGEVHVWSGPQFDRAHGATVRA
jgi:hypothetical protein